MTTLAPSRNPATEANPVLVYLAGLGSPISRRTQAWALRTIADMVAPGTPPESFPWAQLRFEHVTAIRSKLVERYKPGAVNTILAAMRGVLRAAWQLGQISAEDYHRAVAVRNVRGSVIPAGRMVTRGELNALAEACRRDPTPAGVRDGALLALLWTCGLRRAEAAALDVSNYEADTGELRVNGKGRKERTVWVTNGARDAMNDWLAVRGDAPGPLFCPVNKGGRLVLRRMTAQAIYNALRKRAGEAGVKLLSPHDMRRSFVSELLDAGADIVTVAKLAGHANVQTTARYDRRTEEAKRRAAQLLHYPWSRGGTT